ADRVDRGPERRVAGLSDDRLRHAAGPLNDDRGGQREPLPARRSRVRRNLSLQPPEALVGAPALVIQPRSLARETDEVAGCDISGALAPLLFVEEVDVVPTPVLNAGGVCRGLLPGEPGAPQRAIAGRGAQRAIAQLHLPAPDVMGNELPLGAQ